MILPPILELSVVGVFDPGVPNQERIVLRPSEPLNLAQFGILVAVTSDDFLLPLQDHFFWFGERIIQPPSYLIVYTGAGTNTESSIDGTGEPVYVMHWGRKTTLFGPSNPRVVPVIARVGAITVSPMLLSPPPATNQLPRG